MGTPRSTKSNVTLSGHFNASQIVIHDWGHALLVEREGTSIFRQVGVYRKLPFSHLRARPRAQNLQY